MPSSNSLPAILFLLTNNCWTLQVNNLTQSKPLVKNRPALFLSFLSKQQRQQQRHLSNITTCSSSMSNNNNINNINNNNNEENTNASEPSLFGKGKKMSIQPSPPFKYFSSTTSMHNLDFAELDAIISTSEAERQGAFDTSAKIKVLLTKARRSLEKAIEEDQSDHDKIMEELETLIQSTLPAEKQSVRLGNLTYQFQDYARLKSYQYFLSTGKLLPPSQLPETISDEEYLAGAVIGLTQDLARYVIGRATARDGESVILARYLVDNLLSFLMKFDFRNGMLRRKYDGVKYALKTCETVLYELSVTGMEFEADKGIIIGDKKTELNDQPETKRMKREDENSMDDVVTDFVIPTEELELLRQRIEHRDELRESLIKRCRDAQKAAKQAIFALHRNDSNRASKLISQCENIVRSDLNPLVDEDPTLYYGSYSNVLEEYAEAKLFQSWLLEKPQGRLLMPNDFSTVPLKPIDYLGGLCDLTGEIGRFAVQRGTKRDTADVKFCLETNLSILFAFETLQRFPSGSQISKKMEQLKRTVEKLERMLYELSLVQATGREIVTDSVNENESRQDNKGNNYDT